MDKKPDKYQIIKENSCLIEKLAAHGFSMEDIAEYSGIKIQLLKEYLKKSAGFSRRIKNAKIKADLEVEESLLRRATGYETTEEYFVFIPSGGEEGSGKSPLKIKEFKKVKKSVPPDPSSAMAWLHNRRGDKWTKNPGVVNDLSGSEIVKLKRLAVKEMQESM